MNNMQIKMYLKYIQVLNCFVSKLKKYFKH